MSQIFFPESEYPSIYEAADKASVKAQTYYLRLIKLNLILMISGVVVTTINFQDIPYRQNVNIAAAFLLGTAIILSLILKTCRFEKTWYGGRAVAESVKSLSWKYMTTSKPFSSATIPKKADDKFLELIKEIATEKKDLAFDFEINTKPMISQKMKDVRHSTVQEKLQLYLSDRVQAQRNWYKNKAIFNKKEGDRYSWIAILMQFLGFLASLYLIKEPTQINLTGVLSSATTAIFSWMQIKKFQELAQAYAITANELGMAESQSTAIQNDKELSDFINDTENAISREHTMWIARRGH